MGENLENKTVEHLYEPEVKEEIDQKICTLYKAKDVKEINNTFKEVMGFLETKSSNYALSNNRLMQYVVVASMARMHRIAASKIESMDLKISKLYTMSAGFFELTARLDKERLMSLYPKHRSFLERIAQLCPLNP